MPYEQPFLDIALNALTQEQLIQHLRERLLEKDKLTQEIEQLKKQNQYFKEYNERLEKGHDKIEGQRFRNYQLQKENEELKKRVKKLEQEKDLKEFWDEWEDTYDDELDEWFENKQISSQVWDRLTSEEQLKIFNHHQRQVEFHHAVHCDGAPPDS